MRRIANPRKERIYDHYGHGKSPPPAGEKKNMQEPDAKEFINSVRGNLVIAKALAYAMHTIDQLPTEKQEWSDRQDMAFILNNALGQFADLAAKAVEHHTGKALDMTDHKHKHEPHPVFGTDLQRDMPRDR